MTRMLLAAVVLVATAGAGPAAAQSRIAVPGRPFGIAVSSRGIVYVTRQSDDALTRISLGHDSVSGAVAVGDDPGDVVFNAAGTVAYVTNFEGQSVGRIPVGASAQSRTAGFNGEAYRLRLGASGARLYVTTGNGFLYTLNAKTLARVDSIAIDEASNGLTIQGDRLAYVSSGARGRVTEIDLHRNTVRRVFNVGGAPQDVALSRDGSTLFVANQAGRLDIVTLGDGKTQTPLSIEGDPFGLARTPGNDILWLTTLDGHVRRIDGAARTVTRTLTVGGTPRRVAVERGGAVVVANEGNWVDIIR